jgi:hypothetical protein
MATPFQAITNFWNVSKVSKWELGELNLSRIFNTLFPVQYDGVLKM